MDLNMDNYSIEDIYNLFGIQNKILTDEVMKESKKIVLKTHPDKSRMEPKYFLFFSKAYKRLFGIYEFQNKTTKKVEDKSEFYDASKGEILNNFFEKDKDLKKSGNFNKWFNEQFEKHKVEDGLENGYGDWLKSDNGIYQSDKVGSQGNFSNLTEDFEKHKKHVRSLVVYNGVNDLYSSNLGGTLLGNAGDFSSSLFSNLSYQDIKQAHTETIIPVTDEDFHNTKKFNNIEEYKKYRNTQDTTPLSQSESNKILLNRNYQDETESSQRAYFYAKQLEESNKKNKDFWGKMQKITNA
jgi:hypothetical protein